MSVGYRHAQALAGNNRKRRLLDFSVHYLTHNAQRLLLALFLLAADIRNHIVHHLRPVLKGLARPGNCLVGCRDNFLWTEFLQSHQHRRITLDGAVRLYNNKSLFRAKALFLRFN